jgi:hypothetical protein
MEHEHTLCDIWLDFGGNVAHNVYIKSPGTGIL